MPHHEWLNTVQYEPDVISMSFVPITSLLQGVPGSGFLSHAINLYLRCKYSLSSSVCSPITSPYLCLLVWIQNLLKITLEHWAPSKWNIYRISKLMKKLFSNPIKVIEVLQMFFLLLTLEIRWWFKKYEQHTQSRICHASSLNNRTLYVTPWY